MKRIIVLCLLICSYLLTQGQVNIKNKKYSSLFWEISGNGLKKPSWLFGTMHVSSKMAFHLSDSFYIGIKNADIVALETNPESWQDDMSNFEVGNYRNSFTPGWKNYLSIPNDYLNVHTLQFEKYEKQLEQALYSNPSTINNLLYRNYSDYSSDFEEDTYLDMYIYQVGKKWGKKVAGVEKYDESMRLMIEAYRDAAKDKNKKEKSFDVDEGFSPDKLQEAYRTGNLDLLDSINKLNSFSDAFDEKFLYRRNQIQANSIDSILEAGLSLFVGVGAAHLPGPRGVIEFLRAKGYNLRPVIMGERDSWHKEQVERIRVPVSFVTNIAEDKFYSVDVPGKFHRFNEYGLIDQQQYADMANGSYYIVTRVKTSSLLWGQSTDLVAKKIDSILYENVPGKILSKQKIIRNGYKGFDVRNRTRRGDYQRYNIFITPFEILFFKMSGTGDYVNNGIESNRFFKSIRLKEFKNEEKWIKYEPPYGGFSVQLPHEPFVTNGWNWIYNAEDKRSGSDFTIIRTDIHNYHFVEEDTFDLSLLEESFSGCSFIDKEIDRKLFTYKGYPALECKFSHKDGSVLLTRFLIQGTHYYTLIAHGKEETSKMQVFLNSFEITPFIYKKSRQQYDSSLHYSVKSPVVVMGKQKIDFQGNYLNMPDEIDDDFTSEGSIYRNAIISNDSTGEKIYVSFYKLSRYYYAKDSKELELGSETSFLNTDTTWVVKSKKKYYLPDNTKVSEYSFTDANSSRIIRVKKFFKEGTGYTLMTEVDTLSQNSVFLKDFFNSFSPSDSMKGVNPFTRKSKIFFQEVLSPDSISRKKAINLVNEIRFEPSDLPKIEAAIQSLTWKDKKYMDTKKTFIQKLAAIKNNESSDFLKQLYYAASDTVEFQYVILESLLRHQSEYAFNVFRDILVSEPPVLDIQPNDDEWSDYTPLRKLISFRDNLYDGKFFDELYDSLKLTRKIMPDLLPLLNINDYKWPLMRLLATMLDSNLIHPEDYEMYFNKFLIEGKQELKKQAIVEKRKEIERVQEKEQKTNYYDYSDERSENGNEALSLYAVLLLPYWEKNRSVETFINQLLQSNDKQLRYNTMLLLIRNKRKYPDSLIKSFAEMEDYCYQLYRDLNQLRQATLFPTQYNTHINLAKSKLVFTKSFNKPDSLTFIDSIAINHKNRNGYIYFFKYKQKKDDGSWKLASIGLVPKDPNIFEYETVPSYRFPGWQTLSKTNDYNFTGFSEIKLKPDEPVRDQLNLMLKNMLYSKRKSGRQFFDDKGDKLYEISLR